MLIHPTLDKLTGLKLNGMAQALSEQLGMHDVDGLSFEERLGLLVDREMTERHNRKLRLRLQKAHLRLTAVLEDIDYRRPRGLDKSMIMALGACRWVAERHNVLLTGPTGVGKSYLACALAQKACRENYRALYYRMPRLLQDMAVARADGRYGKVLAYLLKHDVLVIDDWGLAPLDDAGRRDLLEILEDRYDRRSTIIVGQIPVSAWHEMIGDPTLADAILDRLVHRAYQIQMKGESMRKIVKSLTQAGH